MKRTFKLPLSYLLLFVVISTNLYGQETGHYVPGITGIKAATLPPPGTYYIMHNVYYAADSYYDEDGNKADLDFNINVFVNAHRFVHVWKDVFWGANYAVNMIVPLINTDISIKEFNVSDKNFGLGDIIIDPMALSWNRSKYDIVFGIGAVVPTGHYDITEAASPGKSWWTGMLTLGGTYYFDEHKSWSASLLSRYEVHTKKKDFDVTPGNDFTFEYGIGKTIPAKLIWTFGASGYAHWQLTEDNGADVLYDAGVKDKVFAFGPEAQCFIPTLKMNFEARGLFEFGAIDRPQGTKLCLSLIKAF